MIDPSKALIARIMAWTLCLAALPLAMATAADKTDLEKALASESRFSEDRARDAGRKPASIVEFLGIQDGMTVVDLVAASGYYTEVLSLAVGKDGKVLAQNPAFVLQFREGANDKAMTARLENDRLPNVERLDKESSELGLKPGSIDAALTALNFHDIYNGRGTEAADAFLKTIYTFLEPGGVLGIIDHAGNAGADNEKLHRIEQAQVEKAALAAGFVIEAKSELLRNPADDRSAFVFEPTIRGKTDRFVLLLRKPR